MFVNPDGTHTLEQHTTPVRVRRADGSWTAVDTRLVHGADGMVVPAAAAMDVRFPAGGKDPRVRVAKDGYHLALGLPWSLPAPVLAGPRATYPEVLSGVDLVLTARSEGFSEVLVVHTREAAANPALRTLRFALQTTGLRVRGKGGGFVAEDAKRAAVFTSPPPLMWDSAGGGARAPEGPAHGDRVSQMPTTVDEAGLSVVPDRDMLADPATVYPVYLDPMVSGSRNEWAMISSGFGGDDEYYKFAGDQGVGLCDVQVDGACVQDQVKRIAWEFGISSAVHSTHVLSATFRAYETSAFNCTPRRVELWRVGAISSATNWNNHAGTWGRLLSYADIARDPDCANEPDWVEFDATAGAAEFAAGHWPGLTVGLRASNEGSMAGGWKRFNNDATLSVTYNTRPGMPANQTTAGAACGGVVGTTSPQLKAQYVDGDGSDTLTSTFEWKQLPSGAVTTVAGPAKPANNYGVITLILGAAAEGKSYSWRVQTRDTYDPSPWSGWCNFTVNASAPPMPNVDSPVYKADGAAHGGPGISADFTFSQPTGDPRGQDVITYVYGWTGGSTTTVAVPAGSAKTVTLTPPEHGFNTLNVYSKDTAGTPGPTHPYTFLTGGPSAPVAHWPLDTIDNHGYTDQIGNADLTPTGTVSWANDARFIGAGAASLAGSSHLSTAGPVLDTTKSFSVAAWARIRDTTQYQTVVSQDGTVHAPFILYYTPASNGWGFYMYNEDSTSTAGNGVIGGAPVIGEWTHLAGVYDATAKRMSLYINGALAGTATRGAVWNATGPVSVGRKLYNGASVQRFRGEISEVRVWQRVVVPDDLWGTDADPGAGTQATPGILAPTRVGSWDFAGGVDCLCGEALDSAYWGRSLHLNGWNTNPPVSGFAGDDHNGNDALWLNHPQPGGTGAAGDGYAATTGPALRTDQSFTVSAWARISNTTQFQAVVSQAGTVHARFILYYSPTYGGWGFYMYNEDSTSTAGNGVIGSAPVIGEWTHLTGVYDAAAQRVSLYINGVLAGAANHAAVWNATGPLNVGRKFFSGQSTQHFRGEIDQVKVFAGAMSDREVKALYNS